ncbi:hypothetical protein COW36_18735 [bacterium (Candidatus Blackallbacteria) CG17_big_fil_post_rev_8_21_14_2_50_48_46]|uniref:Uncharacterized protein n=1 Tax=bacterium (Candidatus Blackallbacteria) CG17_big_fil_post_rev_8_21_14_2_50_48_46 TaxID=2014261 RepID=A0A2M7FZV5_9BACT|nr:MAG: hypothetical protein COW64_07145 [bacterium (Candidatus Blackallbacteria) CG18_big_fil_WC_8_21_14_2_50_49_26]PIW14966.1 MAG: hypothetical protein COW36_18735 [bacterium (Candidatus Blackallbacteria) CG17_big_fil_post_rev_8_21_14_2_50_48_46]
MSISIPFSSGQALEVLCSEHITWEALGLLSFLLAHPGQGFSVKELLMNSNGADSERIKKNIRKLVREKRARFTDGRVFAMEAVAQ